MNIKRYLKYTLPPLILFFVFCWIIIPQFLPQLLPIRSKILLFGVLFFIILGDIVDLTDPDKKNKRR